jgi:hypothetical protein
MEHFPILTVASLKFELAVRGGATAINLWVLLFSTSWLPGYANLYEGPG